MGLFSRKKEIPLPTVIDGLLAALNEASVQDVMELTELKVSFQICIRDVAAQAVAVRSMAGRPLTYADLGFMLEHAAADAGNDMTISIALGRKPHSLLK